MKKFDLGWGEPEAVKQVAIEHYLSSFSVDLSNSKYPPHTGNDGLKAKISQFMLEQSGIKYPIENIFITVGATGAINACLLAMKQIDSSANSVVTNKMYFGFYPKIIENSGYKHITDGAGDVSIQDSPSNPEGLKTEIPSKMRIWDAVYFSPTYTHLNIKDFIPEHDIVIGSASKLLGLSGERIGWLAIRPMSKYEKFVSVFDSVVTHMFCGVNWVGQLLVEQMFPIYGNDGEVFFKKSKRALDDNKTEWSKLKHLFGGVIPNENGMFFVSDIDNAAKKRLDECGIVYKYGFDLGVGGNNKIRVNMAAQKDVLFQAVKEVLKKDKK